MGNKLTVHLEDLSFGGRKTNIPEWVRHNAFTMAITKIKQLMASEATAGRHEMTFPLGDEGYCTFTVYWSIE